MTTKLLKKTTNWDLWWSFIWPKWPVYLMGFISVFLSGFAQIIIPKIFGYGLDVLKNTQIPRFLTRTDQLSTLIQLFILYAGAECLLFISRVGWRIFLGRQTHRAAHYLRLKIWKHALYFSPIDHHLTYPLGELMNASNSDVNAARFIFGFTLIALSDVFFLGILCFIAIATINMQMAFWVFTIFIILPFFISRLAILETKAFQASQVALGFYNKDAAQAVYTAKLQRVTQTSNYWEKLFLKKAKNYQDKRYQNILISLKFIPLMGLANVVSYIILFALGIYQLYLNQITIGDFVAIQSFILLLQHPLSEVGMMISEWQRGKTSLTRLCHIFNHESQEENKFGPPIFKAPIPILKSKKVILNINQLSFGYPHQKHLVLNKVTHHLVQGQHLGIKGSIGSGKSTLLKIISGFEKNYQGQIQLYHRPLNSWSKKYLNQTISIVAQNPFLFADTIRNNLTLGKKIDDSILYSILESTGLLDEVLNFPERLDMYLGERGVNLSGGQRQRLTLARALVIQPKILLLDDCFSAVDILTEEKIIQKICATLTQTTIILVAHRESTLKYCHNFLELP